MNHPYIITAIIIINVIAFLTYGYDKRRAQKNKWRIQEKTLILLALLGGSPGALLGMQIFRHKTRNPLFRIGVPCIMMLQAAGIAIYWSSAA